MLQRTQVKKLALNQSRMACASASWKAVVHCIPRASQACSWSSAVAVRPSSGSRLSAKACQEGQASEVRRPKPELQCQSAGVCRTNHLGDLIFVLQGTKHQHTRHETVVDGSLHCQLWST